MYTEISIWRPTEVHHRKKATDLFSAESYFLATNSLSSRICVSAAKLSAAVNFSSPGAGIQDSLMNLSINCTWQSPPQAGR